MAANTATEKKQTVAAALNPRVGNSLFREPKSTAATREWDEPRSDANDDDPAEPDARRLDTVP